MPQEAVVKVLDYETRQFDVLGDEFFESDSFLVSSQAGYMAEDMIDTGIAELVEKGKAFSAYIKKRKH